MDEVTQHPDLLPRMGFRRLLGGADRLDDTVAITPRRDLEDVHRFESTRPFRARTERLGYEPVTGFGLGGGRSGVGGAGGAWGPGTGSPGWGGRGGGSPPQPYRGRPC